MKKQTAFQFRHEKPYSDIDAEQLKEMLRTLCLAAGFSERTTNQMFGE